MRIPYGDLMRTHVGHYAIVRACSKCGEVIHKRQHGGGRGAGFREGNKGNALVLKHWKEHHPAELADLLEEHE